MITRSIGVVVASPGRVNLRLANRTLTLVFPGDYVFPSFIPIQAKRVLKHQTTARAWLVRVSP